MEMFGTIVNDLTPSTVITKIVILNLAGFVNPLMAEAAIGGVL